MAPYQASMAELVQRYATSPERQEILKGLIAYRAAMRQLGINAGFQWLDGSFVEDCELLRGRSPHDVDLITFAPRPLGLRQDDLWRAAIAAHPELFDPDVAKETYFCDAYFVDLTAHPVYLVHSARYWFGLFAHQRETYLWKGMVEVLLDTDDTEAHRLLTEEDADAAKAES